ncbi:MAG: ABC transporter ATP-binding protein [Bifidobacterium tibiigranuli]|jgi:ABC-type nitrate/sulfonate/bicarbonate transport system ATPase subunit|uniref:ABC transporter ATP-binding protein n=1 Tax=Bifidobacterium tibiigranuli TaxID=2172043 RepID=UPI0026EF479B|nr:ABC transporter ATP-binding protein [Bifidobacterium tibiigranuli]MCI1674166.1 ABC transporter ATP-binding protein [Bifidobacterium tibiigranuli]MCI1712473.1 ABC transporter ATP-binding protein [Bifidobacterium tibiigranuli]
MSYKLHIENVSKQYAGTYALTPTSLTVNDGEFITIVGPSGCGKSTLFNIVSGVLSPTQGTVAIDGNDVTNAPGHVGYMMQKDLLLPWKSTFENILLGISLTRKPTEQEKTQAAALATRYGLGPFLNNFPHTMSGGMRQRAAFLRTLMFNKDVLLLDEPFGALDSQTRFSMQQWLLNVWNDQRRTILFITHDVEEAVFLADRVVVMSPRPGKVEKIIPIELERPRERGILTSQSFISYKRQILDLIYNDPERSEHE